MEVYAQVTVNAVQAFAPSKVPPRYHRDLLSQAAVLAASRVRELEERLQSVRAVDYEVFLEAEFRAAKAEQSGIESLIAPRTSLRAVNELTNSLRVRSGDISRISTVPEGGVR